MTPQLPAHMVWCTMEQLSYCINQIIEDGVITNTLYKGYYSLVSGDVQTLTATA